MQTKGGQITLANNVVIKGNNISLDTTNGTIGTGGAITAGVSVTTANAITLNTGSQLLATNNLNMRANAGGGFNALTLNGTLQAKTITGNFGSVGGASINMNGAVIKTLAGGGSSILSGIHTATSGPGSLVTGTNSITAASGTDFTLTSNSSTVAAAAFGSSRGLRFDGGVITTSGTVAIEGKSSNSDGILMISNGGIKNTGGTVTVTGSSTGNGGGGVNGINFQGGAFLQGTTNTANFKVTGFTANQGALSSETGAAFTGIGGIVGAGGSLEITGYSSSAANSSGLSIGTNISGWGSANLVGQNLRGFSGNAININATVSSTGNMTIQSIGGRVNHVGGSISAARLTIDNTGAGKKSLINDTTAGLNWVGGINGTDMTGSIDQSTGIVTKGIGKSSTSQHGLNLQAAINTSGTLYLSGETSAAINSGVRGISINGIIGATGGATIDSASDAWIETTGSLSGGTGNVGGLTKAGSGKLSLYTVNAMKGVTLVSAGTLALNNVNALQMSTLDTGTIGGQQVTFALGGANTYNIGALQGADSLGIGSNTIRVGGNNTNTTYNGIISGAGNLVKAGTGTQTFTGTNAYTGTTTINAGGALQLGIGTGGGTSGSIATSSAITDNGTLIINRSDAFSLSQSLTGAGGLQKSGTGTTTLTLAAAGYTGTTAVKEGTLSTGANTMEFFRSSAISIDGGATFEANVGTHTIYKGTTTVSGPGTFKKTGTKGLTLSSGTSKMTFDSGFTGLLDIQAGAIQNDNLTNALIANASTINIKSGAVLDIRGEAVQMKGLTGGGNIINSWDGVYNNSAKTTTSGIVSPNKLTFGVGASASDTFTYSGVIGAVIAASDLASLPATASQPSALAPGVASQPISVAKSGVGTQILSGNNTYSGTTAVNGGTLQIGAAGDSGALGAGAVTLAGGTSNLKFVRTIDTTINNDITGAGNVSANITSKAGTAGKLTVSSSNFNLTNGLIDLRADGDVTLNTHIVTSNATANAVKLVAGQAASYQSNGTWSSLDGNVKITGSGNITVGTGGVAAIYSGSIDGTTDTSSMAPIGSGKFRYNSNESTTKFATNLVGKGSINTNGVNIIYREAPTVTIDINNVTKLYDGIAHSGGSFNTTLPIGSALKNGDTIAMATANATFSGSAQGVKDVVASSGKTITASDSSNTNALGYVVTYTPGSLTINKAILAVAMSNQSKTYDGTTAAALASGAMTATGVTVGGVTETATISKASGTYNDKNVSGATTVSTSLAASDFTSGTANLSNYNLPTTVTGIGSISKAKLTEVSATKVHDGNAFISGDVLTIKGVNGEEFSTATQAIAASRDVGVASNNVTNVSALSLTGKTAAALASNYDQTKAPVLNKVTITAATPVVLARTPTVTATKSSTSRVAASASAGFQLASADEPEQDELCSAGNSENCVCAESSVSSDISICVSSSGTTQK